MANHTFPKKIISQHANWLTDDLRIALLSTGYSYVTTTQYLSDMSAEIVARSTKLQNPTLVNTSGDSVVADADDFTFTGLTGAAITQGVIYTYNVSDSAAQVWGISDLTLTPDGNDVVAVFSANGIFKFN